MKKSKLKIIVIVFLLLLSMLLSACGKQNFSHESIEDESHKLMRIALSATDYTYDTLIDDIIKYFRVEYTDGSGFFFSTNRYSDESKYLSQNTSVEKLIDKTFIKKAKARNADINADFIYYLAMLFPDSWDEHKQLVVGGLPLFLIYLQKDDNDIESKVTRAIKANLRDPNSFYMDVGEYVKYYWYLYTRCYNGDSSFYVDKNGKYTDDVYFYVKYHAKNGFGGYNYSGVWLSYSSDGYVSYTGKSGGGGQYAEYNSGYNLYGDNQNLAFAGSVCVHYST